MPLTRTFRHGMSTGRHGEEQPIRSNFPSGVGMNPESDIKSGGTGQGYSTGLSRTTPAVPTPMPAARPSTGLARSAPSYAPAAYGSGGGPKPRTPAGMPSQPAAIRSSLTKPLPAATPTALAPALDTPGDVVASPTTDAAPQTESNNPMTGDGNAQAGGTTDTLNPGMALNITQRGTSTPAGMDAQPQDANVGGSGLYARKFSNPKSAALFGDYTRRLFG